jgi:metallo-beta-lactamase class B
MALNKTLLMAAMALAASGSTMAEPGDFHCTNCAAWNQPQKPFKLYGNTWYVGTRELSALLVTGPKGHILVDGALPQSAPVIEANIKALGFRMKDVKYILNSHEHFDHAGGIAALQRASGAVVVASAFGAQVLKNGVIGKEDAQYDPTQDPRIEKIAQVKPMAEGEVLAVGPLAVTARMTPGHTPGGTTWTWQSCEKGRCLDMVYADSLTAVSADNFRFSDDPARVAQFKATIAKVAALKCDLVVSTHPGFTSIIEKQEGRKGDANPFIDPNGCRSYADAARKRFDARLESEKQAVKPGA